MKRSATGNIRIRHEKGIFREAQPIIEEKAKDMVKHFTEHVFPNGFKAQVVAETREACVRYKHAFDKAPEKRSKN
ncbi:MAG: hypothetical protein R2784_14820 [Saprospiraceae bacterium]